MIPLALLPVASILGPVSVAHYLVVGAVLFVAGVACMAVKRNALGVLMRSRWGSTARSSRCS